MGGIIELSEGNGLGLLVMAGGLLTIYGGVIVYQQKTPFRRFFPGKIALVAIAFAVVGFVFVIIGA